MTTGKTVYLDNAATTEVDPQVLQAMLPFFGGVFGNPSSSHSFGRKAKSAIETSRRTISKLLNCAPGEICFTSGGTEADNLAINAAVCDLDCTHIITSVIEHSAVIKTAERLAEKGKITLSLVKLTENGSVDLEDLARLLQKEGKALVSLMHANNEIANVLPIEEVGEMCEAAGALFHSDTVQTMGHFSHDLSALKIDFITCAAHKLHGPKGVGFLYINKGLKVSNMIVGGGQERGFRGGTENLAGIVGLAKALELAYAEMDEHKAHVLKLKMYMADQLKKRVEGIRFNGDSENPESLYTVLNVKFPPNKNAGMFTFLLDIEGIACSGGSACSSGASIGSHVLNGIHAVEPDCVSVRFSFSRNTTLEDIDFALERIEKLCAVSVKV
ncbi:MAG: cysteine desulfurase [Flavobacteriales bacterium]|jgi:cysteine desulfurase